MKEIVFVDDDLRRMQFFVEFLQLEGFVVKDFESDEEALAYMQENSGRIGLLILDMIMASKRYSMTETKNFYETGLHLLRDIRKALPRVPVIVFSIRKDLEGMEGVKELGVSKFIVKDRVTVEEIANQARRILGTPV